MERVGMKPKDGPEGYAYILTRGRIGNLPKILDAWLEQEINVMLVVDQQEFEEHDDWLMEHSNYESVGLITPPKTDQGVGYIRDFILNHAFDELGLRSLIQCDDDIYPDPKTDVRQLLDQAARPDRFGIGATCGYYGLMIGNERNKYSGETVLCTSGWGNRLFALNVRHGIDVGGFDHDLTCSQEDTEIRREGIARLGIGWYVDTSVNSISIGARYTAGGIGAMPGLEDRAARKRQEQMCHEIIFNRWGDRYITEPPKAYRCKWKNLFNDYLTNWEAEV